MSWTHEHSWKLEAPPDRVFQALTDSGELSRWFAEHTDLAIAPRGHYRFWGKHTLGAPAHADPEQVITRLEAGRVLGFAWKIHSVPTTVTISLAVENAATRLSLHHEVTSDLPIVRQKELIDDHWRLAFGNLAAHLSGGDGIVLPDYADPAPEVRLSIVIDAPREAVFKALIEPELINKWFGQGSTVVEPRPGGRYDLGWKYKIDGRDVEGGPTTILEMAPNEKLVLDWPDWRGDKSVTGQKIGFYLETMGQGTRVTVVHSGFGRTADLGDYPFGWVYFLGKLREVFPEASP